MKECRSCKIEKGDDCFSKCRNSLAYRCKECVIAYNKVYYASKREACIETSTRVQKRTREANHKLKREYLESHPCVDCGNADIRVLDFDHLRDKKMKVSNMLGRNTWENVMKEIEKCEVRCANCHRIKHYMEKHPEFIG